MGTPCEIQLFAKSPTYAKRIADMAIADVLRLEARYSRYRSGSLLSAINQTAASCGEIAVDAETAGLLNYAATCHEVSDGLFDISSGILRRASRLDSGQLPDQSQIDVLLKKVGWHKLRWKAPYWHFRQRAWS